jgi:O-antigen/teichoic acid export membrane protein
VQASPSPPRQGRLIRGILTYGLGGALSRLVGFLTLPLFTRFLTPQDYGISSQLSLLALLLTPVFTAGIGTSLAICYFESQERQDRATVVWTAFAILLVSSLILVAASFPGARFIAHRLLGNAAFADLVVISAVGVGFSMLATPFSAYLQFEERSKLFVLLSNLSVLGSVAINVVLVAVLRMGVYGYVLGTCLGQALTFALNFWPILGWGRFQVARSAGRELLRLGIPMIPSFAALYVLNHGNRFALQWFETLQEVGVFSIGYALGAAMLVAVQAFTSAWTPYFMSFKDRQDEGAVLFSKVMTYYVVAFGCLTFCFFAFARPLILILTQPAFYAAFQVVGLVALGQFIQGCFAILLPPVYFAKDVKFQTLVQTLAAVLSVGLDIVLVQAFGLVGAGLAFVGGFVLATLGQYLWNRHRGPRYMVVRYERRKVLVFAILFAALAGGLIMPRDWPWPLEIALGLAATALMGIAGAAVLGREEIRNMAAWGRNLLPRAS